MTAVAGIKQQFWLKTEVTFDTNVTAVATDAIRLESLSITPKKEWIEPDQSLGTASPSTEVEGREGGEWTAVHRIAPVALGTAPSFGPALKAAFGVETISGGTSVTYSLTDDATLANSLQWIKYAGSNWYEIINGCWVKQLVIEILNGQPTRITASGGFCSYGYLRGAPAVSGSQAAPDTTIQMSTGDSRIARAGRGVRIKFGTEDGTAGAGYLLTDAARATDIWTITPTLAGDVGGANKILAVPVVPSQTIVGSVIPGLNHGMTLGGTSMGLISHKVTFDTGVEALENESTSNRPTRIVRTAKRPIQVESQFYLLNENAHVPGLGWEATRVAVVGRAGPNTANARMTVSTPSVRYDVVPISPADAEVTTYSATGSARQSSAALDEMTLSFT